MCIRAPIVVRQAIETNAASIAYHALEEVPEHAFSEGDSARTILAAIHRRVSAWWPELNDDGAI